MNRYDLTKNTVAELLADPDVVAIVERFRPGLSTSPDVTGVADLTVAEALRLAARYVSADVIEAGRSELEALDR